MSSKQITHRIAAYVLDFFYLLEYVWKLANAYLGEKQLLHEHWVKQQAALLLEGQWLPIPTGAVDSACGHVIKSRNTNYTKKQHRMPLFCYTLF
jgi:hypothetical protein